MAGGVWSPPSGGFRNGPPERRDSKPKFSNTLLPALAGAVKAPEVVAGIRVGVEQHIGGRGVGKDRRPTRQVRGGLDHQRAGLQHIVHPHLERAVGPVRLVITGDGTQMYFTVAKS